MTVNGSKTVIEKDTAFGEHHHECDKTPSYRSARAYTARAKEIRACCPPLNYSYTSDKEKYVPIKGTNRYS